MTLSTKEQHYKENYLCTLATGSEVYKGDQVYRTELKEYAIAEEIFTDSDSDGDRYLRLRPFGNAWIDGPWNGKQKLR